MKKNHIIAAALAILLAGCSAENTASISENVTDTSTELVISSAESQTSDADEKAPEQNSNGELLKVSSFDGKTLTGTKLDMPAMGGNGGGQGAPQGTPPDMNGDMPQKPDDNGNGGNTPPEKPDDNGNGGNTPPEKPDDNGNGGNTPPEKPDDNGNGDNTPPERPDNSDGNAPDGNPPKMSGEEVTYTVSDSADISIEISEGDMVRVVTDENGEIISIEKEEFGGGMPMGQNSFGANGTDNGTSANSVEDNAALSDTAFTSGGDDENALRADNVTATLNNITITKTGSSSNTENGDFYGMNAAFLAENGANITITGGEVTTDAVNGNGIFSYGSGTVVNVSGTKIRTSQRNSGGIQTTGGGVMNAENLDIETNGNSSAAIRSDRGGGTVTVNGGKYTTNGTGSPAIYSTADITVSDAALTANNSEGVVVEGKNSVKLENCTVSGKMQGTYNDDSENIHCIMIYQSMSGDADVGEAYFEAKGGEITSLAGDMFYVTNTSCEIKLSDVKFNMADGVFLRAAGNTSSRGWGKQGENGADVKMSLASQSVSGDIVVDDISTLDLTISSSDITGAINSDNSSGSIVLTLDENSSITLTGDSYVTEFNGDISQINAGNFHFYVNGEKLL